MASESQETAPPSPARSARPQSRTRYFLKAALVGLFGAAFAVGACLLILGFVVRSLMPPSHEDVAEGFRRNPSAFTQVATHILEREKANTRTYHIPCELPKDLVGYGVNSVTTKGPCVFFEAVGIPIFSKGIVYCPRDDAVEQIRKAGPPYEEGFVELREIAPSWYQYVTN